MGGSAMLRATCKIVLGGKDLTERIRPRLSNLTITTSREGKADELRRAGSVGSMFLTEIKPFAENARRL